MVTRIQKLKMRPLSIFLLAIIAVSFTGLTGVAHAQEGVSSSSDGSKLIKDLLPKICKAAEYENSIFSLAKALEKTQKLLNALENVIIPQYKQRVRFILATLEEREREEFARLKKVKASMEKRQ